MPLTLGKNRPAAVPARAAGIRGAAESSDLTVRELVDELVVWLGTLPGNSRGALLGVNYLANVPGRAIS